MALLDRGTWEGRIYSRGWVPGSGGEYDAVEPATGKTLARVGAASPADVQKAAEAAAQGQREWAALTYDRRAEVLRRAGLLFVEHDDEIHEWLIRESGAIKPFAEFQTRAVAAEECYEAAALASHAYGQLSRRPARLPVLTGPPDLAEDRLTGVPGEVTRPAAGRRSCRRDS